MGEAQVERLAPHLSIPRPLTDVPIVLARDNRLQRTEVNSLCVVPRLPGHHRHSAVGSKKLFRIEAGDLLFNIVFAWEGAVAVAKPEDHGRVGSHRFLTCVPKPELVTSSFLQFHFLTDEGLEQLSQASPGGAGRNRTLGQKAFHKLEVPVPAFEKQLWFTSLLEKAEVLKQWEHDADEELDALLPSILNKAFKGDLYE